MKDRRDHPTAKMVFETSKSLVNRISFATVYNTLEYLVGSNLIRKVELDSESSRYDGFVDDHIHLVCNHCENVYDIPFIQVMDRINIGKIPFRIENVSITIRGTCTSCDGTSHKHV